MSPVPELSVEGLACERGGRSLFSGVRFSLHGGEALQVEGRNGSGKTTLLRAICGLTRPSAGRICWGGTDTREDPGAFAARLSYVGHQPGIKDELTPLENLSFFMAIAGGNGDSLAALARIGLPPECDDTPCRKLSAGQRRRVALARLLLNDASLWVLDEPFTALDAGGRHTIEHLLQEHLARGGMALVTSHHALDLGGCSVQRLQLD